MSVPGFHNASRWSTGGRVERERQASCSASGEAIAQDRQRDERRLSTELVGCRPSWGGDIGSPSLSPKGSVRVYDDKHLIFMDIASPTTMENVRRDPRIEINSIDFIRRRGYRFKGTATLASAGHPAYEWLRAWLLDLHGPAYPAHEAVLIRVERALPVLSPAYTFGDADEAGDPAG